MRMQSVLHRDRCAVTDRGHTRGFGEGLGLDSPQPRLPVTHPDNSLLLCPQRLPLD